MPPIIGTAMRCMISDPAPVLHMMGNRPAMMAVTVIIFGRTRSTAPSMIAAWRSALVSDRLEQAQVDASVNVTDKTSNRAAQREIGWQRGLVNLTVGARVNAVGDKYRFQPARAPSVGHDGVSRHNEIGRISHSTFDVCPGGPDPVRADIPPTKSSWAQ